MQKIYYDNGEIFQQTFRNFNQFYFDKKKFVNYKYVGTCLMRLESRVREFVEEIIIIIHQLQYSFSLGR